ncbi:MAG: hypothetical protein MJ244_03295 [Clostridia bacterium]|nr:hypothetical protein [Clostridia bacterium]
MNAFRREWVNSVKPFASECVDRKYIDLVNVVSKRRSLTQNEYAYVKVIREESKDLDAMLEIHKSIILIDAALYKDNVSEANDLVRTLHDYLSTYEMREKLKEFPDSKELLNYNKLRDKLSRLNIIYGLMC